MLKMNILIKKKTERGPLKLMSRTSEIHILFILKDFYSMQVSENSNEREDTPYNYRKASSELD